MRQAIAVTLKAVFIIGQSHDTMQSVGMIEFLAPRAATKHLHFYLFVVLFLTPIYQGLAQGTSFGTGAEDFTNRSSSDDVLGRPSQIESNRIKLEEIRTATPKGDVWNQLYPLLVSSLITEHTVRLGPGFRSNAQFSTVGKPSWLMDLETKHFFLPSFSPIETFKWAILLGSKLQIPDRSEDINLQLRIKVPLEIWLSRMFQLRMLAIADLLRKARWDLDPEHPFPETRTMYVDVSPQFYIQWRAATWVHIRLGMPIHFRLPVTGAFNFFDQALPTTAGYAEYGPALYFNFPFTKIFRLKTGVAYLYRAYDSIPFLTDGPLVVAATNILQSIVKTSAMLEYHPSRKLTFWLKTHYYIFSGVVTPYDFTAFSLLAEMEWKAGVVWFLPRIGFWTRSFSTLTYPNSTLTGFTPFTQSESFLNAALRVVFQVSFEDKESLFFSFLFKFQTFTTAFAGTNVASVAALKAVQSYDVLASLGLFL